MIVPCQLLLKELVKRLSELVIPSFIKHFTISYDVSGKPSEIHFITNFLDYNFVTAKLTGMFFFCINCNLAKIVLEGLFPAMGAKGSYNDSALLTCSSKNNTVCW